MHILSIEKILCDKAVLFVLKTKTNKFPCSQIYYIIIRPFIFLPLANVSTSGQAEMPLLIPVSRFTLRYSWWMVSVLCSVFISDLCEIHFQMHKFWLVMWCLTVKNLLRVWKQRLVFEWLVMVYNSRTLWCLASVVILFSNWIYHKSEWRYDSSDIHQN